MFKYLIICFALVLLSSCRKNAVKVSPELVGNWKVVIWCPIGNESYNPKVLTVGTDAKGKYVENDYITGGFTHEGKVKTRNNDLFVDGEIVFNIKEIKDSSGYVYNPTPNSTAGCVTDSLFITGILRTDSGLTFYRIE